MRAGVLITSTGRSAIKIGEKAYFSQEVSESIPREAGKMYGFIFAALVSVAVAAPVGVARTQGTSWL